MTPVACVILVVKCSVLCFNSADRRHGDDWRQGDGKRQVDDTRNNSIIRRLAAWRQETRHIDKNLDSYFRTWKFVVNRCVTIYNWAVEANYSVNSVYLKGYRGSVGSRHVNHLILCIEWNKTKSKMCSEIKRLRSIVRLVLHWLCIEP